MVIQPIQQAALQRENHLLLEELISVLGRTKAGQGAGGVGEHHEFSREFFLSFLFGGAERGDGNLDDS